VVLDGVNACAAALAAVALCPPAVGYLIAGHRSSEPGAGVALAHLGLDPLLDLGMRLGEGTGALLAVPLVTAAARVLHTVATIDEVG
jgi:nicotinate-nucleotide--dimethylbenzimidazole phosphoribosyltransferase